MTGRYRLLTVWDGPVTAVASGRATAEDSGRALPRARAHRIVADLDRDASRLSLFALYKIAIGLEPHSSTVGRSGVLLAKVDAAVRTGRLLFLAGWDFGDGRGRQGVATDERDEGGTPEEKLVRQVMGKRAAIEFEGRRYRFMTAERRAQGSRQGGPQVVPIAEARAVIERMLKRPTNTADQRALWSEILEKLSEVRGDDGLVLSRDAPTGGGSTPQVVDGPAVTPSQMKSRVTDWIEIRVLYDDGTPYEGTCLVELPDGRKTEGPPGQDGVIRIDGLNPGNCKVTLPDLDKSAWGRAT